MVKMAHGKEKVHSGFDILIDSDAFVGRFYRNDPHFGRSTALFANLQEQGSRIVTTSMVVAETATVLSHREGQDLARKFLHVVQQSHLPVVHINEAIQDEATKIFLAQTVKGTSMTDCANVAVIRQLGIPVIFSFDEVYSKRFGLKTA